jgi:hypothetical protein
MKTLKQNLVTRLSSFTQFFTAITTLGITALGTVSSRADTYSVKAWEFNNKNSEGWSLYQTIDRGFVGSAANGSDFWYFETPPSANDPIITSPVFPAIPATTVGSIKIRMADGGNNGLLQIFWRRSGQGFSEARSIKAYIDRTGFWSDYTFPVTQNPNWSGDIVQLRIDHAESGAGQWGWFDYVRLQAPGNNASCKYYGYYHANSNYFPSVSAPKNYCSLVSPWCNVAFVSPDRIASSAGFGMSYIVDCGDMLFEWSSTGNRYRLKSNYAEEFKNYYNSYFRGKAGQITAFYIIDEPYQNGVSKAEVEAAVALIRSYPEFNNCKTMIVEAFPQITKGYQPPNVDWIGFNQYVGTVFQAYRHMIIESTGKDYFITGDSWKSGLTGSDWNDQAIANAQNFYKELACTSPRCKGILNYVIDNDGPGNLGAKNLPLTFAKQQSIGRLITGKP